MGVQGSNSAEVSKNIVALLKTSASRLSSSVLALTALKVEAAEDHFVKVRSMINDIIATLEAQAEAEATTKSWCDKEMKAAVTTRDAEKAQLLQEIAELSDEIAKTQKALLEATELRADEKKDNLHVISETGVGRDAVEYAIEILQD